MVNNIPHMQNEIFSAFKAYDIREESPKVIDAVFATKLGVAIVESLKPKRVMVGCDMRLTSPDLEKALVSSLTSQGVDVVKIGLCSTPMFNVLLGLAESKFDLGVMITASHNPGKYNGFKLTRGDCLPYGLGSGLENVRDAWPEDGEAQTSAAPGKVTEDASSLDRYVDHVIKLADLPANMPDMKVAIDAGNGMGGHVLPRLLEKCPWIKAEKLYFELDGNFPNHEANPLKEETLVELKKSVTSTGAVCGVAFDGDADRVGFVDEKGETFRGDLLTALFAAIELRKAPGGIVLSDTRASWTVAQSVVSAGGHLEWCKVGHANIKQAMREKKGIFGGEMSMHFYFSNIWNVESGDYAMLALLKELAATKQGLSSMRQTLTHYFHSGEINFEVKDTKSVLEKIKQTYAGQASKVIDIDGIRYEFGDPAKDAQAWWLSIRVSNTEPLVRLNLEAVTKELMDEKIKELSGLMKA
jgi:phosphomannomutase